MKRATFIAIITVLSVGAAQSAQIFVPGALLEEHWSNAVQKFQVENGSAGAPNWLNFLPSFRIPPDTADNYAERVSGVFIAPVTGDYVLIVSSDDTSDLYLSIDSNPVNKRLVAQQPGWNTTDQWVSDAGGGPDLRQRWSSTWVDPATGTTPYAAGIHLIAGQQYYIEGVMNEFGGGDNFAARWKLMADPNPADGAPSNFTNNLIGVTFTAPTFLNISTQPQDTTVYAGLSASFSVIASTDSPIAPAYQWRRGGVSIAGATASTYSFVTSASDSGAQFDCMVTIPFLTNTVTSSTAMLTVQSGGVIIAGGLKQEFFASQDRIRIENGTAGLSTSVTILPNFEAPSNVANNFGRRISGLFTPTDSGNYVFFITSDDDSDLFLSTDSSAENKRLIAQQVGWSAVRTWVTDNGGDPAEPAQKRSDRFNDPLSGTTPYSAGIPLLAGTPYYIEAVHHQGGGGDNVAVTYKVNTTDPDPVNNEAPKFTSAELSFVTRPVTMLTVTSQPQNVTVFEGLPFTFSVVVATDCELTPLYQWRKDGVNITNANGSGYTVPLAVLGDSGQYDCAVTLPAGFPQTVTSSAATLLVQEPPFLTGILKYEYWPGQNLQTVENGTAGPPDPNGPNAGYSDSGYVKSFEAGTGFADNYANRISGFFIPPTTGAYVFFVASNDQSDFFISTDDQPANKRLVAQVYTWTNSRIWDSDPQQRSDRWSPDGTNTPYAGGIILTAGTRYYIEGVHTAGGGPDSLGATYKLVSEPDPVDGDAPKFTGSVIGEYVVPPTSLVITNQPQDALVHAYDGIRLTIGVATDSVLPLSYQWRRNGVNVSRANNSSIGFIVSPSDTNALFDCVITIPGLTNSVTSTTAKLTVDNNIQIVEGSLKDELWSDKNSTDIESLNVGAPDKVRYFSNFEAPRVFVTTYAERITGFFTPAQTGNYVFFDASNAESDLYLSTDDQPANLRLICQERGWSDSRTWTTDNAGTFSVQQKRSDTFVDPITGTRPYATGIPLEANKRYYLEGVHNEFGPGDNFAVTFKVQLGDPDPVDGDPPRFTTNMLSHVELWGDLLTRITTSVAGSTMTVSWSPEGGRLQSSPVIGTGAFWTDVGTANPANVTIGSTGDLFLRVINP